MGASNARLVEQVSPANVLHADLTTSTGNAILLLESYPQRGGGGQVGRGSLP